MLGCDLGEGRSSRAPVGFLLLPMLPCLLSLPRLSRIIAFVNIAALPDLAWRRFGLLNACVHPFCLSCIRSWRSTNEQGVAIKACPVCRVVSHFVTPSRYGYPRLLRPCTRLHITSWVAPLRKRSLFPAYAMGRRFELMSGCHRIPFHGLRETYWHSLAVRG